MPRLLSDLSTAAKKLNEESDAINDVLARVEAALNEMSIGFEVWASGRPLSQEPWHADDEDTPDEDSDEVIVRCARELGYGQLSNGGWGLLVRTILYSTEEDARDVEEERNRTRVDNCSREERIVAVKVLPVLIREIHFRIQDVLKSIEAAKQLVK